MSETVSFNTSDEYIKALLSKLVYEALSEGFDFSNLDTTKQ